MKRQEIIERCPDSFKDDMGVILDHFEGKFNEIRDLLDISSISELDKIYEAHKIADSTSDEIY